MEDRMISKNEEELLNKAIEHIIEREVIEQEFSEIVPLQNDLVDANKTYKGKVTMLFVDMRDSTCLPEKYEEAQLVKIYRSYTRVVIQGVRYSGGVVRDFMGDGILAAFVDDDEMKSSDKAIRAARYITTAIDKILNPVLDKEIDGFRVSCGIGLCTGQVMMTKVGMKGKENDDEAENEYGIAWIGNCTNYACKFSGLVSNGAIFIDKSTYSELACKNGIWQYTECIKGNNIYKGYIAETYYLNMEEEREPFPAVIKQSSDNQSFFGIYKQTYEQGISMLMQKSEDIGKREEALVRQENENKANENSLKQKEIELNRREQQLKEKKYCFYRSVIESGHCKKDYVCQMGQEFWEENLEELLKVGKEIGKSEIQIKGEISYAMVDIYENLQLYINAYNYLVEQARSHPWIHAFTVENIVNKTGCHSALKSALETRLSIGTIESSHQDGFLESKQILEKLGYWN